MVNDAESEDLAEPEVLDLAGRVKEPLVTGLPNGYKYGVSRFADVILRDAFPDRFEDLCAALAGFHPTVDELRAGGGGRTVFVKRFDDSLAASRHSDVAFWGKANITITKGIGQDGETELVSRVRGHEIDMFGSGAVDEPFPGVAVEMEWNNKDPFFDRDLINFQALHQEGAIAVGVIVTRGPQLQELIENVIQSKDGGFKYGKSTTHWDKLIPRVNLGGGGECPLLLIGIQPERVAGIERVETVKVRLDAAEEYRNSWRTVACPICAKIHEKWSEASPHHREMKGNARDLMPPLADDSPSQG